MTWSRGSAFAFGLVERHGGANQCFQRLLVDLVALVEVDGTPRVPFETRVEQARRIGKSRPLGEGHLHDVLVRLARAEHPVVVPDRNASPFPLLHDFGIGCLHHRAEPPEHLAAPVSELVDPRVDPLGRRLAVLRRAVVHVRFSSSLSSFCRLSTGCHRHRGDANASQRKMTPASTSSFVSLLPVSRTLAAVSSLRPANAMNAARSVASSIRSRCARPAAVNEPPGSTSPLAAMPSMPARHSSSLHERLDCNTGAGTSPLAPWLISASSPERPSSTSAAT